MLGVACPTIDAFRGLSGIDCARFGVLVARASRRIATIASTAFLAKTAWELHRGTSMFAAATFGSCR